MPPENVLLLQAPVQLCLSKLQIKGIGVVHVYLDEYFYLRIKYGSKHNIGHEGCTYWAIWKEDIGDTNNLEDREYSILLNGHDE